jgi:hypothetical protein
MKNDPEIDLIRLFAEVNEPGQGDAFVERVSKRMRLLRFAHRTIQLVLAGLVMSIFVFLTPWVIDLTGYVALGSNTLPRGIMVMFFSPIGCIIGGAAGLFVFLRRRL